MSYLPGAPGEHDPTLADLFGPGPQTAYHQSSLALLSTWGISNPALSIAAYAGAGFAANKLLDPRGLGRPKIGALSGWSPETGPWRDISHHQGFRGKLRQIKRAGGLARMPWNTFGGHVSKRVPGEFRTWARNAILQKRLTRNFGAGAAHRIMAGRFIRGATHIAGVAMAVDFATSGIQMLASSALNWEPTIRGPRPRTTETPYIDTGAAATQRQRAIMAIHNSQMSTRMVFGNEAAQLHYD